jgi:hypothetical protein
MEEGLDGGLKLRDGRKKLLHLRGGKMQEKGTDGGDGYHYPGSCNSTYIILHL